MWVSVCTGWWGLGVLCRILDKVGALPEDGWRSFFFPEHIVKNTYIPPKEPSLHRFSVFSLLDGSRYSAGQKKKNKKNGIVDQLDFTLLPLLSQVWPTQRL